MYTQKCPPPSGKFATSKGETTTVAISRGARVPQADRRPGPIPWNAHGCSRGRASVKLPKPALYFCELRESPGGPLLQQRQGRPDAPVRLASALGRVEQQLELARGGEPPPGARDGLAVALQPPRPLGGRDPKQERRGVVADRAHPPLAPVDEPCLGPPLGPPGCLSDEGVDRPQVPVQQRVGSRGPLEGLRPTGRVGGQVAKPLEQARRDPRVLPWWLDPPRREPLQRGGRLAALSPGTLAPRPPSVEPHALHFRLELLHSDHPNGRIGAVQQRAQRLPQLGPSGLTPCFEDVPDAAALAHRGHAAVLARCPSARSSTRATTRRASKCSSTSARAARPWRS